ncbi:TetR/AcrR family transcriptional regulator [Desulfosporosinus sp. BICA1-9]|uniref:TetR/AcrR family transcriptional regulator n=1 Tax=Desulfosporosinus sp. BICA1-9 TaxID=1531958 RepID=UPI00054BA45D|nr:TetR/AcrR family transcriptional regulator [Desulfosporosinus sp. BICA1-9]KJS48350.1 MAG: hypothetical protein VR66_14490 [Peptococcaceae bacterium BRH_c23]KJS89735.1 MAG: hypothetical protein JL57_05590 [Desulfosporosinus sp. BICA1-9]HBW38148.1 TetR/AcrR family transcriptional regulator [Desulfosporosinus sp.]
MDKNDIIKSALKLFHQKGYEATSMEDIAYDLEIKKASLYYHIKSKQELLHTLVEDIGFRLYQTVRNVEASNFTVYEKLRQAVYDHTLTVLTNPEYVAVIHDEIRSLDSQESLIIKETQEEYLNVFKNLLSEGIEAGFIIDSDVTVMAHIILGTCTWPYKWFKGGERFPPDVVASMVCEFVMKAITKG